MPRSGTMIIGYSGAPVKLVEAKGTQLETPALLGSIWQVQSAELAALIVWEAFTLLATQREDIARSKFEELAIAAIYQAGNRPDLKVAVPVNSPERLAELEQLARDDWFESGRDANQSWHLLGFWVFNPALIYSFQVEEDDPLKGCYSSAVFDTLPPGIEFITQVDWIRCKDEDDSHGLVFQMGSDERMVFSRIISFLQIFLDANPNS